MDAQTQDISVLLVDDEDGFRRTLAKRLDRRGLAISQAHDFFSAVEMLKKEPVDVVVLDIKMPEIDGLTALSKIKSEIDDIEVILLTGQATAQDGVAGMKAGAFDYLSKPVEIEHLLGKIRQAFDKKQRRIEKKEERKYRSNMENRLAATERLAALGTLAAGVAHEINNPLAIINEASGWLRGVGQKSEVDVDEIRSSILFALDKIDKSVDRVKRITHQLLDFGREVNCIYRQVNLEQLSREALELMKKTAENHGVSLKADLDGRAEIWSDPFKLRQVLINLLTNAVQAAGKNGEVNLIVKLLDEQVVINVIDNGPGIPSELVEKIFEPFFSTKPPGQGTGLGLSVSRGIIEKLGGTIEVETKMGAGSCFIVQLPTRPDKMAEPPPYSVVC